MLSQVRSQAAMVMLVITCSYVGVGCGDTSENGETDGGGGGDAGARPPLTQGLSADFLHHTLSFVDQGALTMGATRSDALIEELDLGDYAAGPLNVEIAPDRKLALVSLSAGFFSIPGAGLLINAQSIPTDPGVLLFVDLEERAVVGELDTGKGPMGIAFTRDGTRAFVTHFSDPEIAIVDVAKKRVLERVNVGPYSEEIALDDSGTVGIFGYSAAGNVRTFAADDMAGTLSDPVALSGDSAGVAFFPGTKLAYVVQAPNPLTSALGGHTLIDVSDPSAPEVLQDERLDAAPVAYPALAIPSRGSVVVPTAKDGKLAVQEIKLDKAHKKVEIVQTIALGAATLFGAYSTAWAGGDRLLLAVPRDHAVVVVDLATKEHWSVPWEITEAGPMDLAPF